MIFGRWLGLKKKKRQIKMTGKMTVPVRKGRLSFFTREIYSE